MLAGLIPIISHPERNAVFARRPEILYDMVMQGAVAQVTAQSLTGQFGPRVRRTAEAFLRRGLVHVIASDAHNSGSRPPRLSEAVKAAAKLVGAARAEAMVTSRARGHLGEQADPGPRRTPLPLKKKMVGSSMAGRRGLAVFRRAPQGLSP